MGTSADDYAETGPAEGGCRYVAKPVGVEGWTWHVIFREAGFALSGFVRQELIDRTAKPEKGDLTCTLYTPFPPKPGTDPEENRG